MTWPSTWARRRSSIWTKIGKCSRHTAERASGKLPEALSALPHLSCCGAPPPVRGAAKKPQDGARYCFHGLPPTAPPVLPVLPSPGPAPLHNVTVHHKIVGTVLFKLRNIGVNAGGQLGVVAVIDGDIIHIPAG